METSSFYPKCLPLWPVSHSRASLLSSSGSSQAPIPYSNLLVTSNGLGNSPCNEVGAWLGCCGTAGWEASVALALQSGVSVAILPPSSMGLVSPHHPMNDVPAPCGALRVARSLQNPPSTQDEAVWRQQDAHTLQDSLLLALLRASGLLQADLGPSVRLVLLCQG